jgi:hypothetical protein
VIDVSNENVPGFFLLLEMAFQTERCIPFIQQSLVDGAVRRMADRTTLTQRLVLIDKRTALLGMTLEAGFVLAQERKPAGSECLLKISRRSFDRDAFVRLMTIAAAHFAFEHRMMMRQCERCAYFQMTLKTCFRRFSGIDDRAGATAGFDMQTPWTVARFAAHVLGVFAFCLQSCMGGGAEIPRDLLVACRAFL